MQYLTQHHQDTNSAPSVCRWSIAAGKRPDPFRTRKLSLRRADGTATGRLWESKLPPTPNNNNHIQSPHQSRPPHTPPTTGPCGGLQGVFTLATHPSTLFRFICQGRSRGKTTEATPMILIASNFWGFQVVLALVTHASASHSRAQEYLPLTLTIFLRSFWSVMYLSRSSLDQEVRRLILFLTASS